jgi:hypothetical protein
MAAPTSNGLALANGHLLIAQLMAAQLGSGLAMAHMHTKILISSQSHLYDAFDTHSVCTVFIYNVFHIWSEIEGFIQLKHCQSHMCDCPCHLSTFCSIVIPSDSYLDTNIGTSNLTHYF